MGRKENKIASMLAIFIAILALVVSIYEGYEIRKHNRMSLRPYIDSSVFMHEDKLFRLTITNEGLGPAIVQEFSVFANGKKVESWNDAMSEVGMKKFSRLGNLKKGEIIAEGESVVLVQIDTLMEKYGLKYILKYNSIYDERFTLSKEF